MMELSFRMLAALCLLGHGVLLGAVPIKRYDSVIVDYSGIFHFMLSVIKDRMSNSDAQTESDIIIGESKDYAPYRRMAVIRTLKDGRIEFLAIKLKSNLKSNANASILNSFIKRGDAIVVHVVGDNCLDEIAKLIDKVDLADIRSNPNFRRSDPERDRATKMAIIYPFFDIFYSPYGVVGKDANLSTEFWAIFDKTIKNNAS